jgi:hypothetical protein
MNIEPRKPKSSIEITDLIEESVSNAVVRRTENVKEEESLLECSDKEAKSVAGGFITMGYMPPDLE